MSPTVTTQKGATSVDRDIIRQTYPEYVTVEQTAKILHLSKRKCSWMLQNGILPCKDSGKRTRQYKIRRDDVITCLENLHTYDIPRIFSTVPNSPQIRNLTDEEIKKYTTFLLLKWRLEPNPLTDTQVAEFLGYNLGSV